tara:strand:+ start:56 stop:412 length:357 start_codon:yes stop_codon:yes gene_type:complete
MTNKSYSTDGNFELPWSFRVRGKYIDQMDRVRTFQMYLCCSRDQLQRETQSALSRGKRNRRGVIPGSQFKKFAEPWFEYKPNRRMNSNTATAIKLSSVLNYSTGDYASLGGEIKDEKM